MPDVKDIGCDYVEVKVTKKVTIALSPKELLALKHRQGQGQDTPPDRPGKFAQLGQRLKNTLLGRGQSPK